MSWENFGEGLSLSPLGAASCPGPPACGVDAPSAWLSRNYPAASAAAWQNQPRSYFHYVPSLTVMELYCLQTWTTSHLFAFCNISFNILFLMTDVTLCFWWQVENTTDCSLTFNIPKIISEVLTFLWWHTLRHFGSEALKSLTWNLHPHLCPSACSLGLQGRTEERPLPCLSGCAVVLCSWLPVPGTATVTCCSLRLGVMLPGLPNNCYSLHSHGLLQNTLWGWM